MATIRVSQADLAAVDRLLSDIKNGSKKAMVKAINSTSTTMKVQIRKKLAETLNLKASRIEQDMSIQKASYDDVRGGVVVSGKPVGLRQFSGKQLKKGVKVRVYKKNSPTLLYHAYIAQKSGTEHIFWRKYNGPRQSVKPHLAYGKLPKKYRTPVERLTGPRIEDVLAKEEILTPIEQQAGDKFSENLMKQVDEILRRANL